MTYGTWSRLPRQEAMTREPLHLRIGGGSPAGVTPRNPCRLVSGAPGVGFVALVLSAASLVLAPLFMPTPSSAQAPATSDECLDAAAESWTSAEIWVWERICVRQLADMSSFVGVEAGPDNVTQESKISTGFLKSILLDEPFVSALARRSVRMRGVWLEGSLDLSGEVIPSGLMVEDSLIEGNVLLAESRIAGPLSLAGSQVSGYIDLNFGSVEGSLGVERSRIEDDVFMSDAQVAGILDFSESTVDGSISLQNSRVSSSLIMRSGVFEELRMTAARVDGAFDAPDARFAGPIDATGANILDWVWLSGSIFLQSVDLRWSQIGGSIVASRSVFRDSLIINSATVTGSVFLADGTYEFVDLRDVTMSGGVGATDSDFQEEFLLGTSSVRTDVQFSRSRFGLANLVDASVGGELELSGAVFDAGLDLRGVRVDGVLSFIDKEAEEVARWGSTAFIDLRVATVGFIDDVPGAWPPIVRLNGFSYVLPSGPDTPAGEGFISRGADWYVDWLHRDRQGLEGPAQFSRQPYRQLENSLREAGRVDVADDIAIARLDEERRSATGLRAVLGWIDSATIRYGYRPERGLFAVILLWATGAWVVGRQKQFMRGAKIKSKSLFSIDRLVPLVTFSQVNAEAELSRMTRYARWYFYFHVTAGYVLGVLFVTALARLTTA